MCLGQNASIIVLLGETLSNKLSHCAFNFPNIPLKQISASGERLYHDAYTIQRVEKEDLTNFNFVAGMVPYLINLIQDVRPNLTI